MDGSKNKIYSYDIKIDNVNSYIWIGIAKHQHMTTTTIGPYQSEGFGAISCHVYGGEFWPVKTTQFKKIEPKFHISSGDIVTLTINYNDLSLTYSVNNTIIVTDSIENVPYRLAVSMGEKDAQVSIQNFTNDNADYKQQSISNTNTTGAGSGFMSSDVIFEAMPTWPWDDSGATSGFNNDDNNTQQSISTSILPNVPQNYICKKCDARGVHWIIPIFLPPKNVS